MTSQKRFYRPELDALRFFAFFGVLIAHGPGYQGILNLARYTGAFGLSMFFLLSAYLITELLLREREQRGTIAWGLFFTRRALRIWPLYYAAIAAGLILSRAAPHQFGVSNRGIAAMALFVYNWVPDYEVGLLGPLWSISIEEQFYLIWPPLLKAGGRTMALAASLFFIVTAGIWLWVFSARGGRTWDDTAVGFLFFAAGSLIAIATHHRPPPVRSYAVRGAFLLTGLCSFALAARFEAIAFAAQTSAIKLYIFYGLDVAGCSWIFFAFLGMPRVPGSLIYLGRISYGLYVFHHPMLTLCRWLTGPVRLGMNPFAYAALVDSLGLALCIPAAHLSYRYFEKPFLRLKQRFEVVESRPL